MGFPKALVATVTALTVSVCVLYPWLIYHHFYNVTPKVETVQQLVRATGASAEQKPVATGIIHYDGEGVFSIKSGNKTAVEYFIKGDMDACIIISPVIGNSS